MAQKPPIRIEAPSPSSNPATFIFLHGYGDDADGWTNIASQFHSAQKLPHLTWLFPNAPFNQESMTTAWYTPSSFSPIPVGRSSSSSKPEEKEDEEDESKDEILASVEYLSKLVDDEIKRGIRAERIVIGGFSQGCAISLLTGLHSRSRWSGSVGSVVGLSGYLPKIREIAVEGGKKEERGKEMEVFLAHGTRDMLVPMRVFRDAKESIVKRVGEERVEVHEYEGLGHATRGDEFMDLCAFLERAVPR